MSSTSISNPFQSEAGKAQQLEGVSLETFLASLSVAAIVFGVEFAAFLLIRNRLKRVYEPRTYLVPEKRRTLPPNGGFLDWLMPVLHTSSSEFIEKSGLDAYFFLRYLLMLLKIFGTLAAVIIPILIPLNAIGGRDDSDPLNPIKGLDRWAWTNVSAKHTTRYTAHLILAVGAVLLCCYTFYSELRKYIRLRQAYLTSPQHRLRASATTVLVTSIPRKWLSKKALLELYDVFPGGVRNIWINRDYDELAEKVAQRDDYAIRLEKAETELIRLAKKRQMKGAKKTTKSDPEAQVLPACKDLSNEGGLSSGNPHQVPTDKSREDVRDLDKEPAGETRKNKFHIHIPIVGHMPKVEHGVAKAKHVGRRLKNEVRDVIPRNRQTHGYVSSAADDMTDDKAYRFSPNRGSTLIDHQPGEGLRDEVVSGYELKETENENADPISRHLKRGREPSGNDDNGILTTTTTAETNKPVSSHGAARFIPFLKSKEKREYPQAYNPKYENDNYGEPAWKKYLKEKDRPTMRLPLFSWMPGLPLIGQKVDTIHYCRKEIARLNVEIEQDQQHPEDYPLMNSAFIQFNNQIAAHIACQSVNHHIPQMMAPRYLEVNPNDVIWENMKMRWWERYLRSGLVNVMVAGLIIGWAFPVAFVGLISQLSYLSNIKFLSFLKMLPPWLFGVISGVLPPLCLAILMALLPIILRLFAKIQGWHTGMSIELAVQGMYFGFLFVQVFLVVSISSGITSVIVEIYKNPTSAPSILAENLPKSSNFFFSYLLLQAFAQSGGALLQIGGLIIYYFLAPILDTTARQKWERQTNLQQVSWGTFFPVYTNLACIGLVYSVISPLILLFNIFTFGLFWVVFRYNLLYVNNFKYDTGGLLFPRAINQLFTGLYVMEVCLIGLFLLVRDAHDNVACYPHAIVMTIVAILTVFFQLNLKKACGPLFTYLPITLEDEAAEKEREFFKAYSERQPLKIVEEEEGVDDVNRSLKDREDQELQEDRAQEDLEIREMEARKKGHTSNNSQDSTSTQRHPYSVSGLTRKSFSHKPRPSIEPECKSSTSQRATVGLFDYLPDEIEDLTPEQRDRLVARAFQHSALRAKRPVIWIPRDDLGISDDEIYRTQRFSKHIWISNEYAGLDPKGMVVYKRSPPDLDVRDLVDL